MDRKRLIGEEVSEIKQSEIDAWHRGADDGARNKKLSDARKPDADKAVRLIRMYAELGDVHYLSTRFDISVTEVRAVLSTFNITSIEDAKKLVREGIIGELIDATEAQKKEDELVRAAEHTSAQERLDTLDASQETKQKTSEERDLELRDRQDEAQILNKQDRLRQLIQEGLDINENQHKFRIPLERVTMFKKQIVDGVGSLRRQFGGSAKDIVNEIKRLSPKTDIDMLRR